MKEDSTWQQEGALPAQGMSAPQQAALSKVQA